MGQISLSLPISNQPNSTEDPKIASDFTIIQTWANGNVDTSNISPTAAITDAQLASPNTGYRKLLLQASALIYNGATAGDYLFVPPTTLVSSTQGTAYAVPLWLADGGLSAQPTDFQVASKTSYARVRVSYCQNNTGSGITTTFGLYQITALGGGSGQISYTFGAALAGSTIAYGSSANIAAALESGQFTLPTTSVGFPWALGVNLSGTTAAASYGVVTAQLYGYNA
jgi:hypothetical protein